MCEKSLIKYNEKSMSHLSGRGGLGNGLDKRDTLCVKYLYCDIAGYSKYYFYSFLRRWG
jgi:hypothetical protein